MVVCGGERGAAVPDVRRHVRQRPGAGPPVGRPDRGEPPVRQAPQRVRARRGRRRCWCWSGPSTPTRRGAAGYADVAGWGATTDAHHPTTPRPDGSGAAECMRRRWRAPGVDPSAIGYVNAHGTAPSSATSPRPPALGNGVRRRRAAGQLHQGADRAHARRLRGGRGRGERARASARGVLPPTYNLDEVDPDCPADHIRATPRTATPDYALSNSFGFGGQNVSLVLAAGASTDEQAERLRKMNVIWDRPHRVVRGRRTTGGVLLLHGLRLPGPRRRADRRPG